NGTIGRLLDDPLLYTQLTTMIASTDSLLRSANSAQGTLGRLMRDTVLYGNLVRISHGADSLMRMLTTGNGLASKLLTDQTLYDQLNKLVTDLNAVLADVRRDPADRKSTRLNSSHLGISYAVFCLKKKIDCI